MADKITKPPAPNPIAVRLQFTCGDCVFFANKKLPGAEANCKDMGVIASRAPCLKVAPNVLTQDVHKTLSAKDLRSALNTVPEASAAALAMAITKIAKLRAAGFKIGQLVYFNVIGESSSRDYVANYYKGRVIMLNDNGDALIVGNKITATVDPKTLLDVNAWKIKRKKLINKGKIADPKSPFTWERKDEKLLLSKKYRPDWLDKGIVDYRAAVMEARATRQTHDYDNAPVKRKRGRPKGSGKVKTYDVSAV